LNWVDYVLLAILALSAWGGLVQGFSRSALGVVVVGLGLFVAFKYYRLVGEYLDRRFDLGARLENFISARLGGGEPAAVSGDESIPKISGDLDSFTGLLDQFLAGQLDGLGQAVTGALAPAALNAVSFLAVFILTAWLGNRLLSWVPHLPILGPIDRAGGFIFGLARGFVYGLLALMVIKFLDFSGDIFGSDLVSAGLDGSQLATAYFGFLHYVWALVTPFSG
jgi:uncharacterized membrane protein required for colicin V production